MFLPAHAALSAIVSQFLGALDAYGREVDSMLAHHEDLALYQVVSQRMDEMRRYAGGVPHVGAPWVEVLIRHFELTHGLWKVQQGLMQASELQPLRGQHAQAVRALQQRLLQVVPQQ
jgi:hypothetical protein